MRTCNCGAKMRLAQKFCDQCGAGTDDPAQGQSKIRKCHTCGISQEDYKKRANTDLHGWLEHWYCEAHNPQLQHSLREMVRFERESIERRAMRKAA